MKQLSRFEANHDDLIHGLNYDYYGKRLVTCSSDQKLKVWDYKQSTSEWELNECWKAHEASILKAVWSHPEFGQVIASCSFDRTVRIWEENHPLLPTEPSVPQTNSSATTTTQSRRWMERAKLVEARGAILDIAFAPSYLGLKLATISSDGSLRIYEAMDVVNLSQWTLMEEVQVGGGTGDSGGMRDPIQEGYCVSWCSTRFGPVQLALGCGPDATVKILRSDPNSPSRWSFKEVLVGHEGPIHAVAWAPNPGRSYELIATACKDQKVRLFKLADHPTNPVPPPSTGAYFTSPFATADSADSTAPPPGSPKSEPAPLSYHVHLIGCFADHQAEVWQVEFNLMGTILASSGDDGKVRLYKALRRDEWGLLSVVNSESPSRQPPHTTSPSHANGSGHVSSNAIMGTSPMDYTS